VRNGKQEHEYELADESSKEDNFRHTKVNPFDNFVYFNF
jgi:hypothetical protein